MYYGDGFSTIVIGSLFPNIHLSETEVTPPSPDTGEPIPQDTMRNIKYGMKAFQKIIEYTDGSVTFAFAQEALPDIENMIGKNQQVRIILPDTFSILFWGGFRNARFSSFVKGQRPTFTSDVVVTNQDDNLDEAGPTWEYYIL
jgi:hypothetical protein